MRSQACRMRERWPRMKVSSADQQVQAITQELDPDLYNELDLLQGEARENEAAVMTRWLFNGIHLFMLQTLAEGNKWFP